VDTNETLEHTKVLTEQLFALGLTPAEILTIFSSGVIALTPFVHPAGFDMHGKVFDLSVVSILADFQDPQMH
jgi:hypothetical protein